ncbi:hypothetical protein HOLleu_38780 [Holothuria leucospilota]|uniref:Uncharacterized protein n=1 Tax=Holothuria leucospilota TaxID=206669 RepID=A0A9Q0YJ93_HOLLE|nr:hypothetical protein HOLleu_38780 [Holothuria leucospilota]
MSLWQAPILLYMVKFGGLKDCCILLNLSHGSFKLLNGVLLEEDADKGREALNDMKVYKLSIYQALKVMKLRPDLQK